MYHFGIDIGGTNIKLGLLNSEMAIVQFSSIPFRHVAPEETVKSIRSEVEKLAAKEGITFAEIDSVGAAVPGSITADFTTVIKSCNLEYYNVPFQPLLQAAFPEFPAYIANDADCAALGELADGALRGCSCGILLTLGTGLGGGIILNGKLFHGGSGHGSEPGHFILVDGGEPCTCGNRGCAEAYCAASALTREARRNYPDNTDSMIYEKTGGNPEKVDPKLVVDCAKEGDAYAIDLFNAYVEHLSSACASMINLYDPQVLALGGGLSKAGDFLFTPLRLKADKKCYFDHGPIVPAKLGNDAGMVGAAMLHQNAIG